jgi:site-specific recombinase XerD
VKEMLKAKEADGVGERHLRDLESRLSYFAAKFDGDTVGTITTREIDDFLRELPVGPMTRNHYRSVVVQMFNFAKKNGYAAKNPAADAAKAKVIGETLGILTVEQASERAVRGSRHQRN